MAASFCEGRNLYGFFRYAVKSGTGEAFKNLSPWLLVLGTGEAFVRIVLPRFSLFTGCLGTGKVFIRIVPQGLQLL